MIGILDLFSKLMDLLELWLVNLCMKLIWILVLDSSVGLGCVACVCMCV